MLNPGILSLLIVWARYFLWMPYFMHIAAKPFICEESMRSSPTFLLNPIMKNIEMSLPMAKDAYKTIGETWVDKVSALVTLGSPIDKFLTLWPDNYEYLNGLGRRR